MAASPGGFGAARGGIVAIARISWRNNGGVMAWQKAQHQKTSIGGISVARGIGDGCACRRLT
jgi:hypothetical protein